jgi:hypothetical protein
MTEEKQLDLQGVDFTYANMFGVGISDCDSFVDFWVHGNDAVPMRIYMTHRKLIELADMIARQAFEHAKNIEQSEKKDDIIHKDNVVPFKS